MPTKFDVALEQLLGYERFSHEPKLAYITRNVAGAISAVKKMGSKRSDCATLDVFDLIFLTSSAPRALQPRPDEWPSGHAASAYPPG
jgi:hypothetical protein